MSSLNNEKASLAKEKMELNGAFKASNKRVDELEKLYLKSTEEYVGVQEKLLVKDKLLQENINKVNDLDIALLGQLEAKKILEKEHGDLFDKHKALAIFANGISEKYKDLVEENKRQGNEKEALAIQRRWLGGLTGSFGLSALFFGAYKLFRRYRPKIRNSIDKIEEIILPEKIKSLVDDMEKRLGDKIENYLRPKPKQAVRVEPIPLEPQASFPVESPESRHRIVEPELNIDEDVDPLLHPWYKESPGPYTGTLPVSQSDVPTGLDTIVPEHPYHTTTIRDMYHALDALEEAHPGIGDLVKRQLEAPNWRP